MKNILVTIDLESKAGLLVDKACELAKRAGSKVWLIHIAAPDPEFVGFDVGPQSERDFQSEELKYEQQEIEKYARQLQEKGVVAEALVIQGATVKTILKETEKLNIDLVIIGHHKHSFLYKAFVGNTDSALVNRSKVPVLIVPLNGFPKSPDRLALRKELQEV